MIQIKNLVFNPFRLNTYILFDETRKAVVIDPACYDKEEENELTEFIAGENLQLVHCLITHPHIDHLLGCNFIFEKFNLRPMIHEAGLNLLKNAPRQAKNFGLDLEKIVLPNEYIQEGQIISFGNSFLEVLYTPGHADGSVCFLNRENNFVIVGDVLFYESIGRTDLPGGSFELLIQNIRTKLLTLEDQLRVFSGHGAETSIGHERRFNPFLNGEFSA